MIIIIDAAGFDRFGAGDHRHVVVYKHVFWVAKWLDLISIFGLLLWFRWLYRYFGTQHGFALISISHIIGKLLIRSPLLDFLLMLL